MASSERLELELTETQVLDFGASRDGVPSSRLGQRMVVDEDGTEVPDEEDDEDEDEDAGLDLDGNADV